ncbi:MAG: hypothetical protein GWN00_11870 [Aliifodinibius sp.]|nr:hypothetical protein [Fodinibius sp.]NIV14752.1 hypothetical protein [Fodinibius sp.]NIY25478.1 hypothetical protein [Fodinibius sp.]
MKAIETTATVKDDKQLLLDSPIPHHGSGKVRLIIFLPEEDDIDEREWLNAALVNPAFDSLNDPEEDIYTDADGQPFND